MSTSSSIKNYTLVKDLKKDYGDKNCASKSFDCSPYVLLDKKAGDVLRGQLYDPTRLEIFYDGGMFMVDKSYFKEFSNSSTDLGNPKSKKGLYIGIGIGVLAIGVVTFLIIKNRN